MSIGILAPTGRTSVAPNTDTTRRFWVALRGVCRSRFQFWRRPLSPNGSCSRRIVHPNSLAISTFVALLSVGIAIAGTATAGSESNSASEAAGTAVPADTGSVAIASARLSPYDATYKTSTSGLSIKLHRSLSIDAQGSCRLTSEGKLLVAGISEVSVFSVEGQRVRPKSYVYQLRGPVNRRREVHFDAGDLVIRSLYKKNWYELPRRDDTLDRMSQQEQLRLTLMNMEDPRQDLSFSVADGRKVKDYVLRYAGDERLETPMGWIETLHFEREHRDPERRSGIWIAPAWDFLMVRTVHVDDGKTTEADLISAKIASAAVQGEGA
ncbi:MAG: DUF3108 domain-containing protein [Pseudomonadota bacterium]